MHLTEELAEVRPALVPHPCFGEETTTGTRLEDADAEVYVLAKTHVAEPVELLIQVAFMPMLKERG